MRLDNGYEMQTTFMLDFDIADMFGIRAIKDTYKRAFKEWKNDYIYLTELVIAVNHHIGKWYGINNDYARVYNDIWIEVDTYAIMHLKGEELSFFYRVTN